MYKSYDIIVITISILCFKLRSPEEISTIKTIFRNNIVFYNGQEAFSIDLSNGL